MVDKLGAQYYWLSIIMFIQGKSESLNQLLFYEKIIDFIPNWIITSVIDNFKFD